MHHPTDRITHTTAFVTPVVEHWLEREIAQRVTPTHTDAHRCTPTHTNAHQRTVHCGGRSVELIITNKHFDLGLYFTQYSDCVLIFGMYSDRDR